MDSAFCACSAFVSLSSHLLALDHIAQDLVLLCSSNCQQSDSLET